MNRIALTVLGLTMISGLGCTKHGVTNGTPTVSEESETATLVGIVATSQVDQEFAYAELGDSKYKTSTLVVKGKAGRDFETRQVLKIKIAREIDPNYHDYSVLLGPLFGNGGDAVGELQETGPAFVVDSGWAMGSGDHVVLAADWVSGAAEGYSGSQSTNVVVEVIGARSARFYLLEQNDEGAKLTLTCKDDSRVMDTKGTFVRVDKCTFGDVTDINSNGERREFIEKVTKIAEETGWTWP